jgi:hypothetical protein
MIGYIILNEEIALFLEDKGRPLRRQADEEDGRCRSATAGTLSDQFFQHVP